MKARVIGAGVMGLVCATALAEAGYKVEIFERNPGLASTNASALAGGMLAPWCEAETAEPIVTRLGKEAIDWWAARVPGLIRNGTLVIAAARDNAELDRFSRRTGAHQSCDADAVTTLEPDLSGRFSRGLLFAHEAHLDPRKALHALAGRLETLGVAISFNATRPADNPVDITIDCRGWAAREDLADLRAVKGEMVLLHTRDISLSRPVRLLHPRQSVYIVPRGGGLFMVGATMVESDDTRPTARGLTSLINAAYSVHPGFAEAEVVAFAAGLRPAFPDNLPHIRRRGHTLYLNGAYRHGFLLAPALARMTIDHLANHQHIPELMDETDHRQRRTA